MKIQFTGEIFKNKVTIERVNKQKARRLFNEGKTIYLQSSNFHPFGCWSHCYHLNKNQDSTVIHEMTFEDIVNEFESYNCNSETGKYTHFYIDVNNL